MKTYSMGVKIITDIQKSEEDLKLAEMELTLMEMDARDRFARELLRDIMGGKSAPGNYFCQNHKRVQVDLSDKVFLCRECCGTYITPIPFGELKGNGDAD